MPGVRHAARTASADLTRFSMTTIAASPEIWVMFVLVGGAAALLLYIAWRCLNGDTRTWAALPRFPLQVSKHNIWPFMLLMIGITLLTALPSLYFEAAGMEQARQFTWSIVFIPLALVIVSLVWWPLALTPRWFRRWASRDTPSGSPWTLEEIEQVKAAAPSQRRSRALRAEAG